VDRTVGVSVSPPAANVFEYEVDSLILNSYALGTAVCVILIVNVALLLSCFNTMVPVREDDPEGCAAAVVTTDVCVFVPMVIHDGLLCTDHVHADPLSVDRTLSVSASPVPSYSTDTGDVLPLTVNTYTPAD
jgi:hypothetical protein